jgi:MFS family permease
MFSAHLLSGLGGGPFVAFGAIYQHQLGASAFEIGLVAGFGMVVATLVMLPGTPLAEWDLRKSIVIGWALAIPAPFFYAMAPHWAWTAGGAFFMQASVVNALAISAYLSTGVPRDRIAMVMTTVLSGYSIGLIVSNLLTGWLAQVAPIRTTFWMSFIFYGLAAVCIFFLPPKTHPKTSSGRVRYRDLMQFPAYKVMLGLFTIATIVIFIPWNFTALYAREVGGVSNVWIGALMGGLYLGSVAIGLCLGRLRKSLGSPTIVLLFEAAYVLSAIVILASHALPLLALAFFLRGGFWSFRQVMTAVIGEVLPDHAMARGYGLFSLITSAAVIVAYPIGGWMYGQGMAMPFWTSAVLMALTMLVTIAVRAYFRANYLKPRQIEPETDAAMPQAA